MPLSYLKHGEIHFVPILRQRLNFAVLVQRAIHELKLDKQDLIAVALPQSIADSIQKAIDKLPTISFITTTLRSSDKREVFPVTPADGMIEAIRTAQERSIPLRYIDQEVPSGHLVNRHCISYQDWPDDALVLQRGAAWYFELIQALLAHPPARFEPVDTWRERYMAEQLRRFDPLYHRILVVCHAGHVNPIKNYLRDPMVLFDPGAETFPKTGLKVSEPSLAILMRYLGDMPKLVELYEQYRQEGKAKEFDKIKALIETIHDLDTTGFQFSIRHYQAFAQLLKSLLEFKQRTSPDLGTVLLACESCFNKPFERRLYRHLISYYDQVKVTRVVPVLDTKEELVELQTTVSDLGDSFVARSCNFVPTTQFDIISPPRMPRASSVEDNAFWPLWERFQEKMNSKAVKLANKTERQTKSVQFQGALHNGLDFRRTLRSQLSPIPTIYVKKHKRLKEKRFIGDEPIVWLFSLQSASGSDYKFSYTYDLYEKVSYYVTTLEWIKFLKEVSFDNCTVELTDIAGIVLFSLPFGEILESDPEQKLQEQFLVEDDMIENEEFGLVPEELLDELDAGSPWWEILLLAAIRYAKENVLCVVPPDFVMPVKVVDYARLKGKTLERVSLLRFTTAEQQKLRNEYRIVSRYVPKAEKPDREDENYTREMQKRFGDVMEQFWD